MSVKGAAIAALLGAALLAAGCGGGDEPVDTGSASILGYNENIVPGSAANELLAISGASFVRVPLNWSAVETVQGEPDFTRPDAINGELEGLGLRPLWVLTGAPCWAAAVPCSQPRPTLGPLPDRIGDYASFAVEVAERYPEALGIEVWNEPNIPNFWRPAPDAALYRQLLSETAEAVHGSGSQVPVVMAGPSPTTAEQAAEDPQKIPFVSFIEEVMAGPDGPAVDAIGVHPYSLLQPDREPVRESLRLFEVARAAAERAAPGVSVWVTEVGLTTAGRNRISIAEQAEGLAEIVATIAGQGVPVITVHRFFDQAEPEFAFEEGFGIATSDGTPKPAFCTPAQALGAACGT
jgi:hypothetical protein